MITGFMIALLLVAGTAWGEFAPTNIADCVLWQLSMDQLPQAGIVLHQQDALPLRGQTHRFPLASVARRP